MENPKEYYKSHGPMTAPGANAVEFDLLPKDIATLCRVVQGVLIHRDIARWLYDVTLSEQQRDDGHIRPLTEMLARIRVLDARPLTVAREPVDRLPSVCRHFSLMLSAILREHGIPARARCGFGAYFNPGKFEDHWVCEYWHARQARWILVDAQLDAVQRKAFNIDFDPLEKFLNRFRAHHGLEAGWTELLIELAELRFVFNDFVVFYRSVAWIDDYVCLEVENRFEIAQRNIEQMPNAARQPLEEPHVRTRRSQLDVAESLAPDL